MMARVIIEVEFSSPFEASVTLGVLLPDNTPLPKGMKLEMKSTGYKLIIFLEYDGSTSTLLSTLDDILASMKIAGDVAALVGKA